MVQWQVFLNMEIKVLEWKDEILGQLNDLVSQTSHELA
jgi:hypothetical protein